MGPIVHRILPSVKTQKTVANSLKKTDDLGSGVSTVLPVLRLDAVKTSIMTLYMSLLLTYNYNIQIIKFN